MSLDPGARGMAAKALGLVGNVPYLRNLVAALTVTAFGNGGSSSRIVEVGSSQSNFALAWTTSKSVITQVIDQGVGSIAPGTNTATVIGPVTTSTTWTLTAADGTDTATAQTALLFQRRRHWGPSAAAALDSPAIRALSGSEFATAKGPKTVTYDCTGGLYPYYAYPAAWGLLTAVTVGGLAFSDFSTSTVSHTNTSGDVANYYVVRFNTLQTGSAIIVVWN